jgi:plasmid stabilization system protein ParE
VVIWSEPAKADLRNIFEYIARDSRYYAKKVTQEIVDKAGVLNNLPRIGRIVPEVADDNVRELSLYSYRLIYEITGRDIQVLAVVHKRRNLKAANLGK